MPRRMRTEIYYRDGRDETVDAAAPRFAFQPHPVLFLIDDQNLVVSAPVDARRIERIVFHQDDRRVEWDNTPIRRTRGLRIG